MPKNFIVPCVAGFAAYAPSTRPAAIRTPFATMSKEAFGKGVNCGSSIELVAAAQQGDARRIAVSGLQPQAEGSQQQQYAGVPPPGSVGGTPPPTPTFFQKARAPFMGLTIVASATVAAWQSNRLYKQRQSTLLDEFAATMVFHLGDEAEMRAAYSLFKSQLGPGRFTGRMFTVFLTALARDAPIGATAVTNLRTAISIFRLSDDAAAAKLLEESAVELERQPSVLNKLVFVAERAMPTAAAMAKLRTKFPNWSFDTVTALQRAMLENLYRELCEDDLGNVSPVDAETLAVLGLSEADANRLLAEVVEKKEEEEAAKAAKAAEEERARQLEEALERAATQNAMTYKTKEAGGSIFDGDDDAVGGGVDDLPVVPDTTSPPQVSAGDGTHEFECTDCGYILFPAAGREFKFFGEGFSCPQCGSARDAFVDNGPVE